MGDCMVFESLSIKAATKKKKKGGKSRRGLLCPDAVLHAKPCPHQVLTHTICRRDNGGSEKLKDPHKACFGLPWWLRW